MAAWALGAWFAGAWGGTVWATGEAPAPTPEATPVGGGYPVWAEVDMARRRRKKREAEEAAANAGEMQEVAGAPAIDLPPVAGKSPGSRRNKLRDVGKVSEQAPIPPQFVHVRSEPDLAPALTALEAKVIKLEAATLIADEEAAILLLLS